MSLYNEHIKIADYSHHTPNLTSAAQLTFETQFSRLTAK